MKILSDLGITFDDVILVPQFSAISSRFDNEIDLSIELLPNCTLTTPIVSANMDTITGPTLARKMSQLGGLGIIHRFMDFDTHKNSLEALQGTFRIGCIGIGSEGLNRAEAIVGSCEAFLIDIAHGHSLGMINQIRAIKELYPDKPIIAGNVATYEGAKDLMSVGACCIKAGVGPGCFAAGTRILMADGTYKNIEEIKLHEKVINRYGNAVEVIGVKFSGTKKVIKYRNNLSSLFTYCTPEHLHWVGDCSTTTNETIQSGCLAKILDKLTKTTPRKSKYQWKEAKDLKSCVMLLPKNINFFAKTFQINLSDFALARRTFSKQQEYKIIYPSYNLGYIFGTFLGDGTANLTKTTRKREGLPDSRNTCGHLEWSFGFQEDHIAAKLSSALQTVFGNFSNPTTKKTENMIKVNNRSNVLVRLFQEMGKRDKKHLPEKYLCLDKEYLKGLLDGLIDSDGYIDLSKGSEGILCFCNTSLQLIELFILAFKQIYGYFPSIAIKQPSAGNLENCNVENCLESYIARGVGRPEWLFTKDYQINRCYTDIIETNLYLPVYDLEVDCPSHSFIANNAIVHNSVCSTRVNTGNGVPQITAIAEVRRAISEVYSPVTLIADGGIKQSGDIVKSIAAGADAVMLGSLLAGTDEAIGEKFINNDGEMVKYFRGMASAASQKDWKGYVSSEEGEATWVPYKGPVEEVVMKLKAGILSGFSYQGSINIKQLQKKAVFMRQTLAGFQEGLPHAKK